jgi:hypothetical protein
LPGEVRAGGVADDGAQLFVGDGEEGVVEPRRER